MPDHVELRVGGASFEGWEEFSLRRSLEAVAGRFELKVSDRRAFPISRGDQVEVAIDGEVAITGHVDRLRKSLGKAQVTVEGRDRTADLVDCSVAVAPLEFQDEGLSAIAAKLCDPFGIVVVLDALEGETFPRFAVQPGESVHEAIERACRMRGLLATTDGLGRLVLTRPVGKPAGVALVEGMNLEDAVLDLDDSARFRHYSVLPQDQARDGVDPLQLEEPEGVAEDLGAREGRVLVVLAEGAASPEACQTRARWEASSRLARAARLTARVQGFHVQPRGLLWRPGLTVPVSCPSLRIESTWIVAEVSMSQTKGSGGSGCDLTLCPERAYQLEAEKPTREDPGDQWRADVEGEEEA